MNLKNLIKTVPRFLFFTGKGGYSMHNMMAQGRIDVCKGERHDAGKGS